MKIQIADAKVSLKGNFTHSEMNFKNIDSMSSSLDLLGSADEKNLCIDCGQIAEIDAIGLQYLYIWLQCCRFRGFEPQLVNLPDRLQRSFQW